MNKKLINFAYYAVIGISLIIFIQFALIHPTKLSSPKSLQGNLLIWHSAVGKVQNIFTSTIETFRKINPQVNILTEFIDPHNNPSLFVEKSAMGLAPSVLVVNAKNIKELVTKKVITSINPQLIDTSIYSPSRLNQVIYQGEIYGIPIASNTRVLCYNKAKLATTNDPILSQPPTTLDGLIQRATKGYSVGMVSDFENTFWGLGAFGGKLFNESGEFQPDFRGWAKWMDWLKNAHLQPNFILSFDRTILHNAFAEGKLAYYVCDSTEIVDLMDSLQDNLRVALLPHGEAGNSIPILNTKVMVLNKSNSNNENHLALAFAKYITNAEQQLMAVIKTQSLIPINRNVEINVTLLPVQSVLLKQTQLAVVPPHENLEQFNSIFQEGEILYQQIFAREISTLEGETKLMSLINNLRG